MALMGLPIAKPVKRVIFSAFDKVTVSTYAERWRQAYFCGQSFVSV